VERRMIERAYNVCIVERFSVNPGTRWGLANGNFLLNRPPQIKLQDQKFKRRICFAEEVEGAKKLK
jgi:hypothetical protein